jgi:TonB family protein
MRALLVACTLWVTCLAHGQKNKETFYLLDKDFQAEPNMALAAYIMHVISQHDTLFISRIYNKNGAMERQESYKDNAFAEPHGKFAWYDVNGRVDSAGTVNNRKKDGEWYYYNDTLGIEQMVTYRLGKEVERQDFHRKKVITPNGETDMVTKKRDVTDTFKLVEKEAAFKGGTKAYSRYLINNLKVPERTTSLGKSGNVKFQFIINKEGYIENIFILKSLEWAADAEALRVLTAMPKWEPAVQNGKPVYYQCIQVITFPDSQ